MQTGPIEGEIVMSGSEASSIEINGARVFPGALGNAAQIAIVNALRKVASDAPLFHPETARGQKMSVRMTSAGSLGWVSDRRGYRYEPTHPQGMSWPGIPSEVLDVWHRFSGVDHAPDSCLINYYGPKARMGLHQDRDEADLTWPVVSISLGDDALFRIGGQTRGGPTQSVWLSSGDVVVLAGAARLAYHGIDRLRPGTSTLLPQGGRINVTLRVAG